MRVYERSKDRFGSNRRIERNADGFLCREIASERASVRTYARDIDFIHSRLVRSLFGRGQRPETNEFPRPHT